MMSKFKKIEECFYNKYPNIGRQEIIRKELIEVCIDFIKSGLADPNFIEELCSENDSSFWSRLSEALLVCKLKKNGLTPKSSGVEGPDFLLEQEGLKIWIEVICPDPSGLPTDWQKLEHQKKIKIIDFPHKEILLRWTHAIKEKTEKLLGSSDGKIKGYIKKGVVSPEDVYVIAVNGCKLRSGSRFPEINGISQFPFALEAVLGLGQLKVVFDKTSQKIIDSHHTYRNIIKKNDKSLVPVNIFLDDKYSQISAIWAVDIDGSSVVGNYEPMVIIHNPKAKNPLPTGLIPAYYEYVATIIDDELEIKRYDGILKK